MDMFIKFINLVYINFAQNKYLFSKTNRRGYRVK